MNTVNRMGFCQFHATGVPHTFIQTISSSIIFIHVIDISFIQLTHVPCGNWLKKKTGNYEKMDQYIRLNKMYDPGNIILEYLSIAWVSILMLLYLWFFLLLEFLSEPSAS